MHGLTEISANFVRHVAVDDTISFPKISSLPNTAQYSLQYKEEKVAWSDCKGEDFRRYKTLLETSKEFGETEASCCKIDFKIILG